MHLLLIQGRLAVVSSSPGVSSHLSQATKMDAFYFLKNLLDVYFRCSRDRMLCSVCNALHGKQAAWACQGSYIGLPDVILEQLPFHTQSFRLSLSSKQRGEKRRCRRQATFFFSFFLMKCMGLLWSCLSCMKKILLFWFPGKLDSTGMHVSFSPARVYVVWLDTSPYYHWCYSRFDVEMISF